MDVLSFIVVGLLSALGVGALVEFYKKVIRKNQSKTWENILVGAVLSIGVSALIVLTGLAYPIFGNAVVNILIYSIAIFAVEYFLDMKLIKKIIAAVIQYIDIEKFIKTVLEKLGITVDKIRKVLDFFNITEDKLREALEKAGFPEEFIEKAIDIIYHEN